MSTIIFQIDGKVDSITINGKDVRQFMEALYSLWNSASYNCTNEVSLSAESVSIILKARESSYGK